MELDGTAALSLNGNTVRFAEAHLFSFAVACRFRVDIRGSRNLWVAQGLARRSSCCGSRNVWTNCMLGDVELDCHHGSVA